MSESVQSEGAAAEIPIRWEDAAGVSRGIAGGGGVARWEADVENELGSQSRDMKDARLLS